MRKAEKPEAGTGRLDRARSSRPLAWLVAVVWMAFIFTLSGQSTMPDWAPRFEWSNVVGHLVVFGVLAVLLRRAFALSGVRRPALWAFLLVLVYACSDEFHQRFVPGRHADPFDLLVDAVGAALALAVLERVSRRRTPEPPPA